MMKAVVCVVALVLLAGADARGLKQVSGPVPTTTKAGTGVLAKDVTSRTGTSAVSQQIQTGARMGSTVDVQGIMARTQAAGRASSGTRAAIGGNQAQAAIQQAARGGTSAAHATQQAAGIAAVTTQGRGQTISSTGVRTSAAGASTSSAIQQAAKGGNAAAATSTGAMTAQTAQIRTGFGPATGR